MKMARSQGDYPNQWWVWAFGYIFFIIGTSVTKHKNDGYAKKPVYDLNNEMPAETMHN